MILKPTQLIMLLLVGRIVIKKGAKDIFISGRA